MENKGLGIRHGIIASVLSILFLLFGGIIMIPIFGEKGAFYACIPIALIGLAFTYYTKTKFKEVFPFALPPVRVFFGSVLLSFGVRVLSTAVSVGVGLIFDPNARNTEINSVLLKMSPVTAIILLAVFPAICEEFFCRGFLIRCFSRIKNEKLIILITSVIFGVMHLDPYSFFYTAIFGALLCFIAIRTKSLLIPMFLHFSSNALSVVVTLTQNTASGEEQSSQLVMNAGQNAAAIIMYVALSAVPLYIGYRLFTGKKVWGKALLITAIVSTVIFVFSNNLMLQSSFVTVDRDTEVIKYEDCIDKRIKLNIEEGGHYVLSLTVSCSDNYDIMLMCGDKELIKKSGEGMTVLTHDFDNTAESGEYYIIIKSADETHLSDTLSYTYRIEKVNL